MNKKRILISLGLLALILIGIFVISELKKLFDLYNPSLIYETEDELEKIYAFDYGIGVEMALEQKIDSKEELVRYRERAVNRLKKTEDDDPEKVIRSEVTLTNIYSEEDIKALERNYSLNIIAVRKKSYDGKITGGGGWPPSQSDRDFEEWVIKNLESEMETFNLTNESLMFGIVSITTQGEAQNLLRMQESSSEVYLVDPGPVEVIEEIEQKGLTVARWHDIYENYEKYGKE